MILGSVSTHIVKVTNTGPLSVSFRAEKRSLAGTGLFLLLITLSVLFQKLSFLMTVAKQCIQNKIFVLLGFSTELDRVNNLPYCETETFEVKFDPQSANVELGQICTDLSIQVGLP